MKEVSEMSSTKDSARHPSPKVRWSAIEGRLRRDPIRTDHNYGRRKTDRAQTTKRRNPTGNVFAAKRQFSTPYLIAKRALDFTLASIMLLALIPVFLVISLVLYAGGTPVFFSHQRVGKSGQLFDCYKFRTMKVNAEKELTELLRNNPEKRHEWRMAHKLEDDPRVTRFGRFLRKTSLDELPQFVNVIRGEMSLVGPRPIVVDELAKYGSYVDHYLTVKPGLTGLWQISGRNNTTYNRRVALDTAYVRNASFGFDLMILLRSALPILGGVGAR